MFNTHVFEVVEKIPAGYFIWNIGENMGYDDYIPICEKAHPNDPDSYDVNVNTLKAIHLDPADVRKLRNAAHYSVTNLEKAEKVLKSKQRGYLRNRQRAAAKETIEIFKAITA